MLVVFLTTLSLFVAAPAQAQSTVWSATLTPKELGSASLLGCNLIAGSSCTSFLTDNDFTYNGVDYTVRFTTNIPTTRRLNIGFDKAAPQALKFRVGSTELALSAATLTDSDKTATWSNTGVSWTLNQQVSLSLIGPPPSPVTVWLSLPDVDNPDAPSVREGESITVAAHLSEAASSDVEIPIILSSSTAPSIAAKPGEDYEPLSPSSITISAGNTTGTVTIVTIDDNEDEMNNEILYVEIDPGLSPSIGSLGTPEIVAFTIIDNDESTTTTTTDPPTTTPTNQPTPPRDTTSPDGDGSPPGESSEPVPDSTPCGESDREYLERFYEASGGDAWHRNENWKSQEPLEEWFGVGTDEDGEVVSLRLPENNLSGDMPTEELLCLNEDTELKELALWDNEDLLGEVPEELVLAVERAALRYIAEMLNLNPEWFEDYEDPFDFEDWHEGVTTDDDGRVVELHLPGEIPESIRSQFKKREITITTSDGGCALGASSERMGASALLAAVFIMLLAVSRGLRARSS